MKKLMKTALLSVLTAVLGAVFAAAPAHAQTGSRVLVNIPFDFSVGNTALKAGSYTVRETQAGVLAFNSDDGQHSTATRFARGSFRYWNGNTAVPGVRASGCTPSRMPKKV